jgi:benzoate membrane transport protein
MRFFREVSLSAFTAGFIAVLVGLTSSVVIIFQAASAFGATPAQISSWLLAIGAGVGLSTIALSLTTRMPVMVAWSVPGAALLSTAGVGIPMAEGVGAFIVSGALILLAGATGWFERVMDRIPIGLASALLAGVLTGFGIEAFAAARSAPLLVIAMLAGYLAGRRWWPRYAVVGVLAAGVAVALAQGRIHAEGIAWQLTTPVWTTPQFTLRSAIGIALPLFIVTMASQNLPGVAAIRAAGFDRPPFGVPISRTIGLTGAVTVLLAPFGAYALNLSAITAAICLGPEAHPDPARRYTAAVCCGLLYCATGLFAGAMVGLLLAFPRELVAAVAGLALLGTIAAGLQQAMHDDRHREPALLTFLITLSGVTLLGIGSAFWGVVAGVLALGVQRFRRG